MNKIKTAAFAVIAGVLAGALFASAQVTTTSSCYQFTRNLKVGNTGADVKALQQTLNARGFTVAAAGQAGSAGMETSYFGNATKNALIKWQEANAATTLAPWGLTSGTGFFGATSRAEMNKCSGTVVVPPTATGTVSGAVAVSLASVQPNNVLVATQAHAKLADFVFSGTGIVTGVQLQRTGISNNSSLTNVYLYDGMTKISDAASVMADGSVRFNLGTGLFSVTGSKTISVYADIANQTSGQSVGVALVGYTTSGNPAAVVSGVNGPNLPIGSATLAGVAVATTTSQGQANIGDQNVNVWSAGITVSNHDVYFVGGSFRLIGSAPYTALSNVKLYIDGVQVGNAAAVDASGRISFYGGNYLVRSGYHTVNVRGDVADGAGRYLQVSLEQGSDLLFEDAQLRGAYVMPLNTSNGNIYNYNGTQLNIGACQAGSGSCTILTSDSQFSGTAARATVGASNQTIGKFKLSATGEPVQLKSAEIKVNTGTASTTTGDAVTNVAVYVNGMAVSSGATVGLNSASSTVYLSNLGGVIVNPGQTATIEVKADLRNPNGTNIGAQTLTAVLSNLQVQGTQSRNISTAATTPSLSVVVGGSTAVFGKTSSFSGGSVTPNAQDVKIGAFTMSTGYSEGANLTQIDVTLTPGGSFDRSQISSLTLKSNNGQSWQRTAGSGTGSTTLSFSLWDNIPANSSNTYEVLANFNNATGSVAVSAVGYFTGQVSNSVATDTAAAVTTTFSEATIGTISLNSTSDSARFVNGNTKANTVFLVNSTNNVKLTTLELVVSNPAVVADVMVNNQAAQPQGNGKYQITLANPITLTSGFGSQVPVQLSFVQPTNTNGLSNATTSVSLTYLGTDQANVSEGALGAYTAIGGAKSNDFTAAIAMPTEVKAVSGSTINNGSGVKLGTITVVTDGSIRIDAVAFNTAIANSGAATNVILKRGGTNLTGTYTGGVYTFSAGDIVSGTVTYDVYADIASMTSSGSVTVSLGAASSFSWNDSQNPFDGAGIPRYGN